MSGIVAWGRGPGWTVAASAGLALSALVGTRMRATDPPWLDVLLPRRGRRRARALAVALVAAPAFLLPSLAALARAGAAGVAGVGALAGSFVALCLLGSLLGAGAYVPVALAIVALGALS